MWTKTGHTPVLPPKGRRKFGRPKKKRIRALEEYLNPKDPTKLRKLGQNSVYYRRCGKHGHNRRTCATPLPEASGTIVQARGRGTSVQLSARGGSVQARGRWTSVQARGQRNKCATNGQRNQCKGRGVGVQLRGRGNGVKTRGGGLVQPIGKWTAVNIRGRELECNKKEGEVVWRQEVGELECNKEARGMVSRLGVEELACSQGAEAFRYNTLFTWLILYIHSKP